LEIQARNVNIPPKFWSAYTFFTIEPDPTIIPNSRRRYGGLPIAPLVFNSKSDSCLYFTFIATRRYCKQTILRAFGGSKYNHCCTPLCFAAQDGRSFSSLGDDGSLSRRLAERAAKEAFDALGENGRAGESLPALDYGAVGGNKERGGK